MDWLNILIAIAGAVAGLSGLIIFFVNRHDAKRKNNFTVEDRQMLVRTANAVENLGHKVSSLEQDTTRLQLLNLIQNDATNKDTILKLGQHYFQDLHGNMYMTDLFAKWCRSQGIADKVVDEIIYLRNNGGKDGNGSDRQ